MKDIINTFVDSGHTRYGIYALGMLLIYGLTISCAKENDQSNDQE